MSNSQQGTPNSQLKERREWLGHESSHSWELDVGRWLLEVESKRVPHLLRNKVVNKAIATPSGTLADVGYWSPATPLEHGQSYVYNTTLCALTLQVYYRMLPTYMESAIQDAARETFEDSPGEITLIAIETL